MEGESIKDAVTPGLISRMTEYQTIKGKRLRRWVRRLHRRYDARREYVRMRDAKKEAD